MTFTRILPVLGLALLAPALLAPLATPAAAGPALICDEDGCRPALIIPLETDD